MYTTHQLMAIALFPIVFAIWVGALFIIGAKLSSTTKGE
jgi:hypothetical protein